MNSKAIYTVFDSDGIHEFSTDIAGGFSYPFEVFISARLSAKSANEESIMEGTQPHEMLPLMRADYQFPKEIRGKKIFSELSDEQTDKLKMDFIENSDIPYHITLDYQKNEIGFEFNKNIRVDELCDLRVPFDDKLISSARYKSHAEHLSPDEVNEKYRLAIAELCQRKVMRTAPLIVVELDSPKGRIDIHLPIGTTEMNSLRSFVGTANLDSFDVKVKAVHHENLNCLKELRQPAFTVLNELTHTLRNSLGTEDTPYETFAAVMEADDIVNVKSALSVAQNIDAYECIHAQDDEEYGHYVLYESCRDDIEMHFAERVEDYIDFEKFGCDCAEDDGAVKTSKGYVVRDEHKLAQRMSPQISGQSL